MSDNPIFAFVLMPFSKEFDDVYNLGIKEAAASIGIVAARLDEQMFEEGMVERIYQQIECADIIIADMSGRNSNVFYEVGYAHAKEKLCILLTRNAEDIPFDLKNRRHIVYSSLTELRKELTKNLEWARTQIKNSAGSRITISALPPSGTLAATRFTATATLEFKFDLYNAAKTPLNFQQASVYSNKRWEIRQNGKECLYGAADIGNYEYRFVLSPPVATLPPNAMVQLQFDGSLIVADRAHVDVIYQEYTLADRLLLQLLIDNEIFQYELPVKQQLVAS